MQLKALVLEDNDDHFNLIRESLAHYDESNTVALFHEKTLSGALSKLGTQDFDFFLCDLSLPDSSIEKTVETLKSLRSATPIVVLTSFRDDEIAKELVKNEIQDYLPKDELTENVLQRMCFLAMERKKEQVKLQQRDEDMQIFCSSLSHDFQSHIGNIKALSVLLKDSLVKRVELEQSEEKWFGFLQESASDLSFLVGGLSQFLLADYKIPKSENVDLVKLFNDLFVMDFGLNEQKPNFIIKNSLPIIKGSHALLTLLFHNLISNSVKYNENKPCVTIEGISNLDKASYDILLTDNGIGIKSEHRSEVFKPFQRLHDDEKYKGSGLGLSIVKRIAEKHSAKVEIESKTGEGSTFIVSFPEKLIIKNSESMPI